ncbi:MAG: hypothetical protein ACOC9E_02480 [Chloroflexota bacterium]
MARQALFAGLVYDEYDNVLSVTTVGEDAFYVVDDDGFLRHIESEHVDRQVLEFFLEQLEDNKDLAIGQAMSMMGKDDIFTKAALDAQMRNINADEIIEQGMPEQARNAMGMVGFRIIVNVHGDVVRIDQPAVPDEEL